MELKDLFSAEEVRRKFVYIRLNYLAYLRLSIVVNHTFWLPYKMRFKSVSGSTFCTNRLLDQ